MSILQSRKSVQVFAPAKLNLVLEVLRRRRDGYHEIETLFQALEFGDDLKFFAQPDQVKLDLRIKGLPLLADSNNLVTKAFELMAAQFPRQAGGVRIELEKRIPIGAGLGGGSSDATATIMALARLWNLKLPHDRLTELALELGSDLPFFLMGGTAIGRGRGEILEKLPPLTNGAFLLVNPGIKISATFAYEGLKMGLTGNLYRIRVEQVKAYMSRFPSPGMVLNNRLEDVIVPANPILERIAERLEESGAVHTCMSGSGSTMFGTFPGRDAAEKAMGELDPGWWCKVVAPSPRGVVLTP